LHQKLSELGLTEGAPVTIMPQGALGLLPLHAAWRDKDGTKRFFLDDYTVGYAPSAYTLSVSRRRSQEATRGHPTLLAVTDPTGDLPYTILECESIADLFNPPAANILRGAAATQEAILATAPGYGYLHFACHGFYNWREAMRSGLVLAGGDPFELGEIIAPGFDLGASRLVTLSACETGLIEFDQTPDEYIGLPAGFLQAGAPAVVSTLWAVNDLSTSLLMREFYRLHLAEQQDIAHALRNAQRWLRDATSAELGLAALYEHLYLASGKSDRLAFSAMRYYRAIPNEKPFEHPYHWAAFVLSGAFGSWSLPTIPTTEDSA
jgi:CHAT domain-containing protein